MKMDSRIAQLVQEKKRIERDLLKIWEEASAKLIEEFRIGIIDEDELLLCASEYVANTEEIERMLWVIVSVSDKKGLNLSGIKANLAERLYLSARSWFLAVPQDDLGEALRLFKELKDEHKIKECESLFETMFVVSDSVREGW